jgi:hypothetical protein
VKETPADIVVTFSDSQTHAVLDAEDEEHEFSVDDEYDFSFPITCPTRLTRYLPTRTSVLVVPSGEDPNTAHLQPDVENWVAKIRKIVKRDNDEVSYLQRPFYCRIPDFWYAGLGQSRVVLVAAARSFNGQEFVGLPLHSIILLSC